MKNSSHFIFVYPKGIRLHLKDKSFNQAIDFVWNSEFSNGIEPIKLICKATGKMLYIDKNIFQSYLSGTIQIDELVELTEVDELYRNRIDIISGEKIIIESGSLWKLKQSILILIDEDQYATHQLNLDVFEIAETIL